MIKRYILILSALATVLLFPYTSVAKEDSEPKSFISIQTIPDGAEISINSKQRGSGPLDITDLKAGKYLISVSERNYLTSYKTIEFEDDTRLALEIELEPITGLIFIESNPVNADVLINETKRGTTPLLVADLQIGEYTVTLSSPGYQTAKLPLKVRDRVPQRLYSDLRLDAAELMIVSEPVGASVSVNGVDHGVTPCKAERVPEGNSTIVVTATGYHTFTQTLRLTAGDKQKITARLRPIDGSLKIVTIPPGARIYMDNQFQGTSPVDITGLKPGTYRVRADMDVHDPEARDITVGVAENKTEEFRMTPNCGAILITTEPSAAIIMIDGKERGITIAKSDQTDRVSEPLKINLVKVGDRELLITKKGYFKQTIPLAIEREKTKSMHVALKRRFIPDYEVRTRKRTFTGVLKENNRQDVMLETAPGVTTRIMKSEIISYRVLRGKTTDEETE